MEKSASSPASSNSPDSHSQGSEIASDNPPASRAAKFLDNWDPLTWQTPEHITPFMRICAGAVLVVMAVMMFYVPMRILGIL
jgi:hypothetical protein